MRMNERFATLYMMFKGKKLGLDFSEFDATVPLGAWQCAVALLFPCLQRSRATKSQELHFRLPASQAAARTGTSTGMWMLAGWFDVPVAMYARASS
jgi:hypothetical protein